MYSKVRICLKRKSKHSFGLCNNSIYVVEKLLIFSRVYKHNNDEKFILYKCDEKGAYFEAIQIP